MVGRTESASVDCSAASPVPPREQRIQHNTWRRMKADSLSSNLLEHGQRESEPAGSASRERETGRREREKGSRECVGKPERVANVQTETRTCGV
eukprot:892794-Rhodomonas_salina.2